MSLNVESVEVRPAGYATVHGSLALRSGQNFEHQMEQALRGFLLSQGFDGVHVRSVPEGLTFVFNTDLHPKQVGARLAAWDGP